MQTYKHANQNNFQSTYTYTITYLRYVAVASSSGNASELTIGFGADTFAILLRNGPSGAVHSSKTILQNNSLMIIIK